MAPPRGSPRIYAKRLLAYVDILGWSDLIREERTPEVMNRIMSGLLVLQGSAQGERARKRIFNQPQFPNGRTLRTMFFSDSLVCSCAPTLDESTLLTDTIQKFCQGLVGNGLYPRGAIVVGHLLHAENGTIVGPALLDAYDIERSVARYPRIIVSSEAAPLLKRVVGQDPTAYGPPQVRTDRSDGLKYFDLYQTWIAGKRPRFVRDEARLGRRRLKQQLRSSKPKRALRDGGRTMDIRAKRLWMLHYLDEVIGEPIDDNLGSFGPAPASASARRAIAEMFRAERMRSIRETEKR